MKSKLSFCIAIVLTSWLLPHWISTQLSAMDDESYSRTRDIVYGRRDGVALTLDLFQPKKKPNGAAIIQVISGGYVSSHEAINPAGFQLLLDRGYSVFAVVPGSQPRYQVPEILDNLQRAVRFIRSRGGEYGIDTNRIGITGSSAGGNLSLLVATLDSAGNPKAKDPIDRESARVQAAAVFFPLTDFLNWSKPGEEHIGVDGHPTPFKAAFDYRELNSQTGLWERVSDADRLREITMAISPIYAVTSDDPPILLMHGDKDFFVPIYQSEQFLAKLQEKKVKSDLIVKPGGGHGWQGMERDIVRFADWFDQHLK